MDQMRQASVAGLWFVALTTALALPDICGALASENGRATGSKYRAWVSQYIEGEDEESAERLWKLRCSLLHQGSMQTSGMDPIGFLVPDEGQSQMHGLSIQMSETERINMMSIPIFVDDVATGVGTWLNDVAGSSRFARNVGKSAHLRRDDLQPVIRGAWVIR
ncbi:hypothetical protein [Rhodococcus sp. RS1C4]|nr:hypothetical protein [Rhodococcus sp. RS1C4]